MKTTLTIAFLALLMLVGIKNVTAQVYQFYLDQDGDGWGNASFYIVTQDPTPPQGYAYVAGDCNDANPYFSPGVIELCNGYDDNCSGEVDENCGLVFFQDADGDGYGNPDTHTTDYVPGYVWGVLPDCNDNDASIHPGETETCNNIDDNCNGYIDDAYEHWYYDFDGDGYGDPSTPSWYHGCTPPSDWGLVTNNTDCNFGDPNIHPGATEICNGVDDNCNGSVDEGVKTTFYRDVDADGYGNPSLTILACSAPSGYVPNVNDCNDAVASIHSGAAEICNTIDDNCDGTVDEGCSGTFIYHLDNDGDGYGANDSTITSSSPTPPSGYSGYDGDCNDSDASVHPGVAEVCNIIDDNCNGTVDEGVQSVFYQDADGDGSGNPNVTIMACSAPSGYVSNGYDPNDGSTLWWGNSSGSYYHDAINMTATVTHYATCIGDDTLDEIVVDGFANYFYDSYHIIEDEPDPQYIYVNGPYVYYLAPGSEITFFYGRYEWYFSETEFFLGYSGEIAQQVILPPCPGTTYTYYLDGDGDGYGEDSSTVTSNDPTPPVGYAAMGSDCNDGDASVNPGAAEVCNSVDDNCDGTIDEGVKTTFYADADGDSYGNTSSTTQACSAPSGYVANSTDCNDASASVHPEATETCNNVDDDCDASIDEGVKTTFYADADGDGYGNPSITNQACSAPSGYVSNNSDCNDGNANVNPAKTEICNNTDDNCNSQIDEGVKTTFYRDADGDGYGNPNSSTQACSKPSGYVANSTDCDDTKSGVHPGVTDICNSIDDNCNGQIDENGITAAITPTGTVSFCEGGNITLTANTGMGLTYQWMKNGGNISGATKKTFTANASGSYQVKETKSNGCSATSVATTVNNISSPTATITPQGNLNICQTGSVILQANTGTGLSYQWLKGSTNISGATNSSYKATAKGTYKVVVTNSSNCSKTSAGVTVTKSCKVGDEGYDGSEELIAGTLNIYPNPTTGIFVIDLNLANDDNEEVTIQLYNSIGQLIQQEKTTSVDGTVKEEIHLASDAPGGLYLIRIIAGEELYTKQLIVQE